MLHNGQVFYNETDAQHTMLSQGILQTCLSGVLNRLLAQEQLVAQADVAPGKGRGSEEDWIDGAKDGAHKMPEHRHFAHPKRPVKRILKRIFHHKFGFHLENPGGFMVAFVRLTRRKGTFFAAGVCFFGNRATTSGIVFFGGATVAVLYDEY